MNRLWKITNFYLFPEEIKVGPSQVYYVFDMRLRKSMHVESVELKVR